MKGHACKFLTADIQAAEPGQILICPFCGEPSRVDLNGHWVVEMTWRERRRWRKEQRKAHQ